MNGDAVGRDAVVEHLHDVRALDLRRGGGLAREAGDRLGVAASSSDMNFTTTWCEARGGRRPTRSPSRPRRARGRGESWA